MFDYNRGMRLAGLVLLAMRAFGEPISVGIKTGVPFTNFIQTAGEIGRRPYRAEAKNYIIGPVLDVRLPHGFGFEFGAMYRRFNQQAGEVQVIADPGVPYQQIERPYSVNRQSWEFPLVGQYRLPGTRVKPYVEAGVSFNRLRGMLLPIRTLISHSAIITPQGRAETRSGPVVGGGLEIKLPFMRVSPGLRYTRYGEVDFRLPAATAVDVLVGFTF